MTVIIAKKIELKLTTVNDLLERGWTYVESENEPAKWLSPAAGLKGDVCLDGGGV